MRLASNNKIASLKAQFAKHLVVANPKLNDDFLKEVLLASFDCTLCLLLFDIQYKVLN